MDVTTWMMLYDEDVAELPSGLFLKYLKNHGVLLKKPD